MDFDVLKDLVLTVTRNKIKQIEVLGNPGADKSRVEALYDGISKGKITSDEQAAQTFFGTPDPKDPNYKKLKNKLVRQLINTSFFIDVQQSAFTELGKAYYNCYKDFAAATILLARDANTSGIYILHQVLEQSIKFEFTELCADITLFLRKAYAQLRNDRPNQEKFIELHRNFENKRSKEVKALDYYDELIHYYTSKKSPSREIHEKASNYFNELIVEMQEVDTFLFYLRTYQIGIIKFLSQNDCKNTILLCDEALSKLKTRKGSSKSGLLFFASQKLACQTQLRLDNPPEINETINYCLNLTDEGVSNWFNLMCMIFYNKIYTKKYIEALHIYQKATSHPRFNLLGGIKRDEWKLFRPYLYLLAIFGKLELKMVEAIIGKFKLHKALNEFEVADKDKEGMNIPIMMLPVLFSIAQKDYLEFGRSTDALNKYRQRYLENDINRRSASFIKLLLALSQKEFEKENSEKKIKKELEVLKNTPEPSSGQSYAIEIIPYEDLWEMLN